MSTKALRVVYDELDADLTRHRDHVARAGHPVSCKRGCNACCHLVTWATPTEAKGIVEHLERDPLRRQYLHDVVMPRAREQAAMLRDETMTHRRWHDEQRACPLLLDGSCSVYRLRPIVCRTLLVISDPKACEPPQQSTESLDTVVTSAKGMWAMGETPARMQPLQAALVDIVDGVRWFGAYSHLWPADRPVVKHVPARPR